MKKKWLCILTLSWVSFTYGQFACPELNLYSSRNIMPQIRRIYLVFHNFRSIYCYRFGKFLQQLDPESRGWGGNAHGNPMPESDYWYSAFSLDSLKGIEGYFALKK